MTATWPGRTRGRGEQRPCRQPRSRPCCWAPHQYYCGRSGCDRQRSRPGYRQTRPTDQAHQQTGPRPALLEELPKIWFELAVETVPYMVAVACTRLEHPQVAVQQPWTSTPCSSTGRLTRNDSEWRTERA